MKTINIPDVDANLNDGECAEQPRARQRCGCLGLDRPAIRKSRLRRLATERPARRRTMKVFRVSWLRGRTDVALPVPLELVVEMCDCADPIEHVRTAACELELEVIVARAATVDFTEPA